MLTLMTGLNSVFLRAGSSHQKQRQKSDCQDFCFLLKKEVLKKLRDKFMVASVE